MLICPLSPETLLELTDLQHQSIRFADMTTLPLDVEKAASAAVVAVEEEDRIEA